MLLPDYQNAILRSTLPAKEALAALIRQAIYAHTTLPPKYDSPARVSRLGGLPDLPSDLAWPLSAGRPQSFIGQLDLAELPGIADRRLLPTRGYLFFFCDVEKLVYASLEQNRTSYAVLYAETLRVEEGRATERVMPSKVFKAAPLAYIVGASAPDWEHPLLEDAGLSWEERYAYVDVISQAETEGRRQGVLSGHQILGYPAPMQYSVAWDAEGARLNHWQQSQERQIELQPVVRAGLYDWELLLQVDVDDRTGMDWPGSGRLYYMIRRSDLVRQAFNETWLILQAT